MKALVTGAGGMLARSLVPALERAGHEVRALGRADADVTRLDELLRHTHSFLPDWVFHLAAYTKVDDCESRPDHAFLVNGVGSRNAALAASECGAAILGISTDYVFDGNGTVPYREYDASGPQSVYGASKWAGEQAIRELAPRHIIVRTAWLFGDGGANFIDTILRKASSGEPLRVVDDQRGSPTWTHDLAGALVRLAGAGQFGTYHVTNSGDCTWYELAAYALAAAGLRAPLEPIDSAACGRPAPRPAYSVLSNQLYEHATGHRMPHWQEAVERYLQGEGRGVSAAAAERR